MEEINQYKSFLKRIILDNSYVSKYIDKSLEIQLDAFGSTHSLPADKRIVFCISDHSLLDELEGLIDFKNTSIEKKETRNVVPCINIFSDEYENVHLVEQLKAIKLYKSSKELYTGTCAFILFHELGHIVYDGNFEKQLKKEEAADEFAFKAVLSNSVTPFEQDPNVLGTLLGLFNILYIQGPSYANTDIEHPHPLDRVQTFLQMAKIPSDSAIWDISCKMINKCLSKHNLTQQLLPEKCTEENFNTLREYVKNMTSIK